MISSLRVTTFLSNPAFLSLTFRAAFLVGLAGDLGSVFLAPFFFRVLGDLGDAGVLDDVGVLAAGVWFMGVTIFESPSNVPLVPYVFVTGSSSTILTALDCFDSFAVDLRFLGRDAVSILSASLLVTPSCKLMFDFNGFL